MAQKRQGMTKTSSVSISDEFMRIIRAYKLSPTEVFRKGMGVTLYGMGVQEYNTEINELRFKEANKILEGIDKRDEFIKSLTALKNAIITLEKHFHDLVKQGNEGGVSTFR